MMRTQWILQLLKEKGPMTKKDIVVAYKQQFNVTSARSVSHFLRRLVNQFRVRRFNILSAGGDMRTVWFEVI